MKKIITIFSFLVALTFMAGPSYALVGMPDDVPGTNILQPFFLVDMAGYDANTGLDTLIVITDVSVEGNIANKDEGSLHLIIRDKKSHHRGDGTYYYTPGDVVAKSVRDLLKKHTSEIADLPLLEYDLDNDGTNDTYVGYIDWECGRINDGVVDNLMAQVYVVDLANGRAAGTNAPARENASADGYNSVQNTRSGATTIGLEVFTGAALAMSDYRERNDDEFFTGDDDLILTPRWYLTDADATNYLFFWTSESHGSHPDWTYDLIVDLWDKDENSVSRSLNVPYELNIIDVRAHMLPTSWIGVALGGWFNVPTGEDNVEWLAYSYQIAESASAGLNWSGLFDVHRNIGDFTAH